MSVLICPMAKLYYETMLNDDQFFDKWLTKNKFLDCNVFGQIKRLS